MVRKIVNNEKVKNISYILIGQAVFMLATLFINYEVENSWGSEGFASFSLIKRTASFIVFPLVFGAGIAIPRYISFLKENKRQSSVEYLIAGLLLFFTTFLLFLVVVSIFPGVLTYSFHSTNFESTNILLAILLYVLSQGIYVIVFSFYRGKLLFKYSTILNIVIMSLVPITVLFSSENIISFFKTTGLFSVLILVMLVCSLVFKINIRRQKVKEKTQKLFSFGWQRVIGEIALFSLDFVPIYLVSIKIGLIESGYLSMSLLMLKLAAMLFELAGSMILPYFGKMYVSKPKEYFIKKVNELLVVGALVAIVVSFVFYHLSGYVIENFFESQVKSIQATQALFIAFPIYVMYIVLRNIIDIISKLSYNSINLAIVVLIQICILFLGFHYNDSNLYHKFALTIPYAILGLLTYITWKRLKRSI